MSIGKFSSGSTSSCSTRLSTLLRKIPTTVANHENISIISDFCEYMEQKNSSENHQVNNLKVVMDFARYLGPLSFYQVKKRDQIIPFLNKKIKTADEDAERRWITTWNHYLNRIKLFERWLHNYHAKISQGLEENEEWITPEFCKIKPKQTKRISPYLESEIWDRDELITIIKYEPNIRNKAILSLLWDLNARPHEISLLQIKSIRLRDRYGEGEIPYQAKTGAGPILLMLSFCYVRDWLNKHPFRNEPNARLICNLHNGSPIKPKTIWNVIDQLKNRIKRLLLTNEITDKSERQKLEYLLRTKKYNPYCFRHSSISHDSDYLPDYALKKKVRWSMNSKQGSRYIKKRMGQELKEKILVQNGVLLPETAKMSSSNQCNRCLSLNPIEDKYCANCSYPLSVDAYNEIKASEEKRLKGMEEQIRILMESRKDMLECMKHPKKLLELSSQD